MENLLLVDIGSTYTKTAAVNIDSERVVGTAKSFTTIETDINDGLEKALLELKQITGIKEYSRKFACSSAAGGLKMIAVGLVPDLTAEAAKMAALSAGAKVIKTYAYELSMREADEISASRPDIVLLSGGTDGGDKKVILHNAAKLAEINGEFPVVVAGNKSAAEEVEAILTRSGKEVRLCENVMPEFNSLNIEPARELIRQIFLQRIIQAKGLTKVQGLVEGILMPTPSAVLNAASLLSKGSGTEEGLGDLLIVDVGGATTDVYSISDGSPDTSGTILKGLPEPFEKRTVEGDLGVRYNAETLLKVSGVGSIAARAGIGCDEVIAGIERIQARPDILALDDEKIGAIDHALACMAVNIAVERHAGRIGTAYTMFGQVYVQTGKELGRVSKIIGTGGSIIHSVNPAGILKEAMFDSSHPEVLKPRKAGLLLDKQYILAAMGLLGQKYPEIAVRIMKNDLEIL